MHLFEFMDLPWLNGSLRSVLREILEVGNSRPFRTYYDFVAQDALRVCQEQKIATLYELGAGTAPISRHVNDRLGPTEAWPKSLRPCDLNPDQVSFKELEKAGNGRVSPIYSPVDYFLDRPWKTQGGTSALLFSATFHHLTTQQRVSLIRTILPTSNAIVIAEPLHRDIFSVVFAFGSLVPALLLPVLFLNKPRRMQRILWCWLLPVAPIFFVWDGIVSALRQWSRSDWNKVLFDELGLSRDQVQTKRSFFSEIVIIQSPRRLNP